MYFHNLGSYSKGSILGVCPSLYRYTVHGAWHKVPTTTNKCTVSIGTGPQKARSKASLHSFPNIAQTAT